MHNHDLGDTLKGLQKKYPFPSATVQDNPTPLCLHRLRKYVLKRQDKVVHCNG